MVKATGDPRPITQGHRFDCDRDVTKQAGLPSEERCHNVATTGVDSGGIQETGGDNRMAGQRAYERLSRLHRHWYERLDKTTWMVMVGVFLVAVAGGIAGGLAVLMVFRLGVGVN